MTNLTKKGNWLNIIIPKEWEDLTLSTLFKEFWHAPKKLTHQFRMDKKVLLNGKNPNWNEPLVHGERLQLLLFADEISSIIPEYQDIQILFEDDHLLIVNKPAGMDTHPNTPGQTGTLLNAVAYYMQANGERNYPRHIHRLDRDTSGTVLFAKHALAGVILDKMLEERTIKRTYLALVDGILKQKKATINKPIGRDRHHPTRRRVSPTGQDAVTHLKVLKIFPKAHHSLVQCQLDTGRTHQIRVHLSDFGYPLAGDTLYGGSNTFIRQALHAVKLELLHPLTKEKMVCHAPFNDYPPIFHDIDPNQI